MLNKYSTSAILNELSRVLNNNAPESASKAFIEVSEGRFIDPHLSLLMPMSIDDLSRIRKEVDRIIGLSKTARAAFITLGLTETWKDLETGMYLNAAPPPNLLVRDKGRFVFENSTFTRSLDEMSQVVELLKRENPEIRVVITVSPVPLGTTFTTADVIAANTYSKSTLRAVAQALYDKYDYVDYFPSYEMVLHSPRELAWGNDQLHVRAPMVEHVVGHFMKNYIVGDIDAAA